MAILTWLHLVGAAVWLGGLVTLAMAALIALRSLPRELSRAFVRRAAWGFAALSGVAWLLVGASGLALAERSGWPALVRAKAFLGGALLVATVLHVVTGRLATSRLATVTSRTLALLVFLGTLAIFWLGVQAAS